MILSFHEWFCVLSLFLGVCVSQVVSVCPQSQVTAGWAEWASRRVLWIWRDLSCSVLKPTVQQCLFSSTTPQPAIQPPTTPNLPTRPHNHNHMLTTSWCAREGKWLPTNYVKRTPNYFLALKNQLLLTSWSVSLWFIYLIGAQMSAIFNVFVIAIDVEGVIHCWRYNRERIRAILHPATPSVTPTFSCQPFADQTIPIWWINPQRLM